MEDLINKIFQVKAKMREKLQKYSDDELKRMATEAGIHLLTDEREYMLIVIANTHVDRNYNVNTPIASKQRAQENSLANWADLIHGN